MDQVDYQKRAQEELQRLRSSDVVVVHMRSGEVYFVKNRYGISGNKIPTKCQWTRHLGELRETNGDFRLWELTHDEADRILKGRVNLW
jgi:hypothetical protein